MDDLLARQAPHSLEAEQAVLDSLRRRRIERDLIPGIPPETLNAPLK